MTNVFFEVTDAGCLTKNVPQTQYVELFVPIVPSLGSGSSSKKARKLSSKQTIGDRKIITVVFEEKRTIKKDERMEEGNLGGWGWCIVS